MTDPDPADRPNSFDITPLSEPEATRAFEQLVREHYGRLCSFVVRFVGSREAAEDVVHEVLLKVWRRRQSFGFRDPMAYLYQAARNEAINHHRRRLAEERSLTHLKGLETTPGPDTAAEVEVDDLARAVGAAVNALPERCQLIFRMNREQGLTYAEIARALGLSVKTVENQMSRAFKALRLRLAPFLGVVIALASSVQESQRIL